MYGNRLVATSAHFPAIEIDVRSWLLGIRIRFIVGPSASRNLALSYDEARLPTGSMLTNYLRLGPSEAALEHRQARPCALDPEHTCFC